MSDLVQQALDDSRQEFVASLQRWRPLTEIREALECPSCSQLLETRAHLERRLQAGVGCGDLEVTGGQVEFLAWCSRCEKELLLVAHAEFSLDIGSIYLKREALDADSQ